jgi:hypothetical protein
MEKKHVQEVTLPKKKKLGKEKEKTFPKPTSLFF